MVERSEVKVKEDNERFHGSPIFVRLKIDIDDCDKLN
jgi:hypothetical protein